MFRDKFNLRNVVVVAICLIGMVVFSGCVKDDGISYPYTEYEIIHLGNKSGLTSSSSDKAFEDGLNDILQTWVANNPSTNEVVFDGITYEFTNFQEATGAIPNSIWDIFWKKLDEYSYSIGSCWGFSESKIPSKGGVGTAYMLYTIVTQEDRGYGGEVSYFGVKCNISPKSSSKTKSAEIYQFDDKISNISSKKSFTRQRPSARNRIADHLIRDSLQILSLCGD